MNPENTLGIPERLLAQIVKNQDHVGLQNLHGELNEVEPQVELIKRFFSKKVFPELESEWSDPTSPLYLIRQETLALLKNWKKFQREESDLCREVITEDKLQQQSHQNSSYEQEAILLKKEINRWALRYNRVIPEELRVIGEELPSKESSIEGVFSEAEQAAELLATETFSEAEQSIESRSSVEQHLKSEAYSYGNLP